MAAKTEQSKAEAETVIRWSELDEPATLWTASVAVRNEWRECGYAVVQWGGGWQASVPSDRVCFKILSKKSKDLGK